MRSKSRRYWIAGLLVLLVMCSQGLPPYVGEFPVFLGTGPDQAYLVTAYVEIDANPNPATYRLYQIDPQGNSVLLRTLGSENEWIYDLSRFAVAATLANAAAEPVVLGVSRRSAWSLSRTRAYETTLAADDTLVACAATGEIRVVERAERDPWVYFSRCHFGYRRDVPPLLEFGPSEARFGAEQVFWAHCSAHGCQQLRLEDGTLTLYAAAVSGDALRPITQTSMPELRAEEIQESAPFGEKVFGFRYSSCSLRENEILLRLSDQFFALSTTNPSLTVISDPSQAVLSAYDRACPAGVDASILSREFSDGSMVAAYSAHQRSPIDPDCGVIDRALKRCPTLYRLYETHVSIWDREGRETRSYPLHDY